MLIVYLFFTKLHYLFKNTCRNIVCFLLLDAFTGILGSILSANISGVHSLHVVCRLVYLTHFHFCTHIHAVVIICVCQIFIKETACLLAYKCIFGRPYRSIVH